MKDDHIWSMDHPELSFRHLECGPYPRLDQLDNMDSPSACIDMVTKLIMTYSRGELSFDEDSLKAITGVLRYTKSVQFQFANTGLIALSVLIGLPFMTSEYHANSLLEDSLVVGLSWRHVEAQIQHDYNFPHRRTGMLAFLDMGKLEGIDSFLLEALVSCHVRRYHSKCSGHDTEHK